MELTSILAAILAIGLLIIIHEAGHFFAARYAKMKVERFSIGFGPAIAKVKRGETEYQVGALPLGGFVQIEGMNPQDGSDPASPTSYANRPVHLQLATIFAGPASNYALGLLLLGTYYVFFAVDALAPVRVLKVVAESPAAAAGLRESDLIVGTTTRTFDRADDLREEIQAQGATGLDLIVDRDGTRQNVRLLPSALPGGGYRIGVEFEGTGRRDLNLGVVGGIQEAFVHVGRSTKMIVQSLAGLFKRGGTDQVSGPIGMVKSLSRTAAKSWTDALRSVADISVMLGFMNLLPIPALDGSRLMFLILGVIRRKPINARIEAYVHIAGFILLMGLLILVSIADVLR